MNRLNKEVKEYQTSDPFFFTKWHTLNPAYHTHYINLFKIINLKRDGTVSNSWQITKKNNYFIISEIKKY